MNLKILKNKDLYEKIFYQEPAYQISQYYLDKARHFCPGETDQRGSKSSSRNFTCAYTRKYLVYAVHLFFSNKGNDHSNNSAHKFTKITWCIPIDSLSRTQYNAKNWIAEAIQKKFTPWREGQIALPGGGDEISWNFRHSITKIVTFRSSAGHEFLFLYLFMSIKI